MASTIAACSSGSMPCAIAIVRLSGPEAFSVLDGVFVPNAGKPVSLRRPRALHYGRLLAKDGLTLDLCLAACFPGPHSYTGEDLAEIYCHGSQAVVAALLDHCFAWGAVPAPPGEFTKRAFLAGRLDLTEAEAVADLIHSQSELGAKAAVAQLEGSVGSRVKAIRERIMSLLAHFYAVCDYTDEDLDPFEYEKAVTVLEEARSTLDTLHEGFRRGCLVRDGVPVAIIGKPNAGKSSLFNALAGSQKAIVTDEAGTTRDVLEEVISVNGAPIRILDTAGLRNSDSKAERMGVERARMAAMTAHAVICVLDFSRDLEAEDREVLELIPLCEEPVLVLNKTDLTADVPAWAAEVTAMHPWKQVFKLSAKDGQVEALAQWLSTLAPKPQDVLITSARQAHLLQSASDALSSAVDSAREGMTADAFLMDAERAVNILGQITGETASADLAHEIFSRFCVGK
ncbi:MAG: tRNA uridine-5-carboxymethylaminomethyl(34) synthesis GTPase MnmE [Clostridia bacterium]|nr:tRNA uridine-5-carboxymethylaminomethyl(34) synthesis GTPase MnmE [Clostridia bacterium]